MARTYPGTPFSRGLACNKFRSCNYMMVSCDPFLANNPGPIQNRPYCVCRRTTSRDASKLECPQTEDDGGECEIPRRNLLFTQAELPCLCFYKFKVLYPFITRLGEKRVTVSTEDRTFLDWVYREHFITAPALRFSQCSC
ncbi:hypothetical protein Btru_012457 [Bulinus truncatus]|nr:hypothetical protein Btru_012457 [Bulinus truncatus]